VPAAVSTVADAVAGKAASVPAPSVAEVAQSVPTTVGPSVAEAQQVVPQAQPAPSVQEPTLPTEGQPTAAPVVETSPPIAPVDPLASLAANPQEEPAMEAPRSEAALPVEEVAPPAPEVVDASPAPEVVATSPAPEIVDPPPAPEIVAAAPPEPVVRSARASVPVPVAAVEAQPVDETVTDEPSPEVVDASVVIDDAEAVEAARLDAVRLQPIVEATPVPAAEPVAAASAQPVVDDWFAAFAAADVFPQAVPTPETAGVQAASLTSDRTAITVQVVPPFERVLQAIGAVIPSTGGPTAIALATALIALGALGLGLRWAGRERARRP
jgi:hypothetical protein